VTVPAAVAPAPAVKTGTCKASAKGLSCVLPAAVMRASKAHGVKATLSRGGKRVTVKRVRVVHGKVELRITRHVRAGHYTLVLTRGKHKVARQTVAVAA
jgi:hypothetical protein